MKMEHGHGMGMKKCWHWSCCILPIISCIMWVAGIVFVVAAWVSVIKNDLVWGYGAQWWIWNALMFGILAMYGKGRKWGGCRGGGCGCGMCGMCKPGMYKVEK